MSLRDLIAMGMSGMAEYAKRQQAIDARAMWLCKHRAMNLEDARRVAVFVLGSWAQRYPVRGYDLGEDATLFLADWLVARHVGPTDDNLYAAFDAWPESVMVKASLVMTPRCP